MTARAARHPLLLLLALATLLRLPFLGRVPLSIDEAITADVVRTARETGDLREALLRQLDAPILPLIDLQLTKVVGVSAWSLRLPAALAGIASVLLVHRLVLPFLGPSLALGAGLLAAISPFLVFHSMDARPYALLLLASLLFMVAYFESDRGLRPAGRPGAPAAELARLLGLALCMDLVVLSHYAGAVFLAFFHLVMGAEHLARRRLAVVALDLLAIVAAVVLFGLLARLVEPDLARLVRLGIEIVSGDVSLFSRKVAELDVYFVFVTQVLFLGVGLESHRFARVYLLYFVLLILPAVVNRYRGQPTRMPAWLVYLWLLPVVVSALADALLGTRLLYYPRAYIATTPLLLTFWLVSYQELRASRRSRRAYLVLFLLPTALSGVLVGLGSPWHPEYAARGRIVELVRRIEDLEQPGDAIVVHHWVMAPYFRAFHTGGNRIEQLGRSGRRGRAQDGGAERLEIERLAPDHRVILVRNHLATMTDDPDAEILRVLDDTRPLLLRFPCGDVSPLVCEHVSVYGPTRPSRLPVSR